MPKDIGFLVVSDGIGEDVRSRFQHCLQASKPRASFEFKIMGDLERGEERKFNKCTLLNQGLKQMFKCGYKVIIQTDIDLICPPSLIDKTFELAYKKHCCVHCAMRRVDPSELAKYKSYKDYPFNRWKKYKSIYATGCWNGLIPRLWKDSGGFNEDMTEWGYEDRDWRERAMLAGIKWEDLYRFSLMHVDHLRRTKNVSLRNVEMAKKAKRQGKQRWI